jgi:hypothetical protein
MSTAPAARRTSRFGAMAFSDVESDFLNYIVPAPPPVPPPPDLVAGTSVLYISAFPVSALPTAAKEGRTDYEVSGGVTMQWMQQFKIAVQDYTEQVVRNLRIELMDAIAAMRAPSALPQSQQDLHAAVKAALGDLHSEIAGVRAQIRELGQIEKMVEARRGELKMLVDALASVK